MSVTRLNICLPDDTLKAMDKVIPPYKRSQWLHYAAKAALAGTERERDRYLAALRALVSS